MKSFKDFVFSFSNLYVIYIPVEFDFREKESLIVWTRYTVSTIHYTPLYRPEYSIYGTCTTTTTPVIQVYHLYSLSDTNFSLVTSKLIA